VNLSPSDWKAISSLRGELLGLDICVGVEDKSFPVDDGFGDVIAIFENASVVELPDDFIFYLVLIYEIPKGKIGNGE
jgi:hypothetical protein